MGRTLFYSFAGAGIGFLSGFVMVRMMVDESPPSDTTAVTSFLGGFLAGAGAVAGAIVGAVAFFQRRQQARDNEVQRESEPGE
jgi:hypothetical protein